MTSKIIYYAIYNLLCNTKKFLHSCETCDILIFVVFALCKRKINITIKNMKNEQMQYEIVSDGY